MPSWWINYNWGYVIRKDEIIIKRSIEQKIELMLWMRLCNQLQGLIREPTQSFQTVFNK